jgi:hypothetical protein
MKHISSHESGARLDQVAHIACKKDHTGVLENSVSGDLDAGFAKIKSSQLVVLWNSSDECPVAKLIPKQWGAPSLVDRGDLCFLSGTDPEHCINLDLPFGDCSILLKIHQLVLLVTGDLAFYADAMDKHSSTRHWCIYCMLNYKEWQTNDLLKPGSGWTMQAMEEIRSQVIAEIPRKEAIAKEKAEGVTAEAAHEESAVVAGVPFVPSKKRRRRHNNDEPEIMNPDKKKGISRKAVFPFLEPDYFAPPISTVKWV